MVNPVDMTVTSYWALDMINKYSNILELLRNKCPALYSNYLKAIESEKFNFLPLVVQQIKNEVALKPQIYLETDIYKASYEIKKMQKLNSNVLTTWHDIVPGMNGLLETK